MSTPEQLTYHVARARADVASQLLASITIAENDLSSSTWDRFAIAMTMTEGAIGFLSAVEEALRAMSVLADDKDVTQLTLNALALENGCHHLLQQLHETAPKVEEAARKHQQESKK